MAKITNEDQEYITNITNAMKGVCDGAKTEDGSGFNKFDSIRVHSVSENPYIMAKILRKYHKQIIGMDFDYDRLLAIIETIDKKDSTVNVQHNIPTMSINSGMIVFKTPYNPQIINYAKSVRGRYNPTEKSWSIDIHHVSDAKEQFKSIFPDGICDNIPDHVFFGTIIANDIKEDVLIKTPYDADFVNYLKTNEIFMNAKRWDTNHKVWRITVGNKEIINEIFEMAEDFNLDFSDDAQENLNTMMEQFDIRVEMSAESNGSVDIPGIGGTLYPFQSAGVKFAEELNGRVLIADEMGLGKTVQSLAWLQLHSEVRPVIIIVPATLKTNWKREIQKWVSTNNKTVVVSGGKKFDTTGDITIINYDVIKKHLETLKAMNPKCVIMDECHYTKNSKAQRTKAIRELVRGVPHVFGLSGTPILNKPIELWTIGNMIAPHTFNNWEKFVTRYCNGKKTKFGWDVSGASNLSELQTILRQTMMVRRVKADVLTELPAKRKEMVYVDISEQYRNEYDVLRSSLVAWLKMNSKTDEEIKASIKAQVLVELNQMRQLIAKAKINSVTEWVNNYMESSTGKLVLFCYHHATINELKKQYPDILVVSGDMNMEARQKSIDKFQNEDDRLIVLTFGAGGVGITLTAAQDVAFVELAWRPSDLSQAEDRIHRIGQDGSVTAWYLLVEDSIDETMMNVINKKAVISSKTLDINVEESIERNMINMILEGEFK